MRSAQRDLWRGVAASLDSGPQRSTRTAEVVSINGNMVTYRLSGKLMDPCPKLVNVSLSNGQLARLENIDNVPTIVGGY